MSTDPLALQGYDYIEFSVGNAKQAAHYYRTAFGFTPVAYAGPETGVRDRCSWVLDQGRIRFVVTGALDPDHPIAAHHRRHGDGVRDVAFTVGDAAAAFATAVARGATSLREPEVRESDRGKVVVATVATYGDTRHSFVERDAYGGVHLPGYEDVRGDGDGPFAAPPGETTGLVGIDHVVGNVELGAMSAWSDWYERVLGFRELVHYDDEQISTEYTALMSKVLWDGEGRIKLPINEPATGRRKSQIAEFLEYYHGPGVQHLALATDDIVATVAAMRARGVRFISIPDTYYTDVRARLDWQSIDAEVEQLAEHGILVDADDEGYLLQIFTEPVGDRPTLFYEVIERHGSRGFGVGNFQALFEAIEREQARRGNL